ncbi:MAG: hypothetical protein CL566_09925 [Alphaproteobacteria bacterium]|nr:hypothetical protein [Alphaproteobacteria bacterium]
MRRAACILGLLATTYAIAPAMAEPPSDTYSVQWENDRIANTDRHYTNGWRLAWVSCARGVARDIFLDGNTFASSHSVDKKHFVGDAQLGFAAIYHGVRLAFTQVFRTREFGGQSQSDRFGAVSLSANI